MLHSKNFDFSFSGLKTAVLYLIRDFGGIEKISEETKAKIALEFENSAIECLIHKTAKAIEAYKIKTLIVAGGVSANKYLRNEMKKMAGKKVKLFFPPQELTGDNSIMIGIAGYLNYVKNKRRVPKSNSIKANGNLRLS
jgi:N6-L-threonylcarbamoyladenine synthase